jgi:hypothetical protein
VKEFTGADFSLRHHRGLMGSPRNAKLAPRQRAVIVVGCAGMLVASLVQGCVHCTCDLPLNRGVSIEDQESAGTVCAPSSAYQRVLFASACANACDSSKPQCANKCLELAKELDRGDECRSGDPRWDAMLDCAAKCGPSASECELACLRGVQLGSDDDRGGEKTGSRRVN